jgi:cobalt-precorrin-5B (C1)-methyltransferase
MMGDHVGHSLRACAFKCVREVVVAGQFAKILKIACGHEQTHVSSSGLDLKILAGWLRLEPRTSHLSLIATHANTARQVLEESKHDPLLVALVCERAQSFAKQLAQDRGVKVLLAGYDGEVLYFG